MNNKPKDYEFSEFEPLSGDTQKSHSIKKSGLSITQLGRLSLTTGLQREMGIDPSKRNQLTFVEILAHKDKEGDDKYTFIIRFYDSHEGLNGPGHTLYKPNRKGVTNYTSYLEFARYLKKKGLITSVGKAKDDLIKGPVDILKKDIPNRSIIINLKSRFKIN